MESSRIIIDPHTFNIYGTPGPSLGSIKTDSHADSADDEILVGTHNVIYRATSHAFREYQNALEKHEKRRKENMSGDCRPASYLFTSTRTMSDTRSSQDLES